MTAITLSILSYDQDLSLFEFPSYKGYIPDMKIDLDELENIVLRCASGNDARAWNLFWEAYYDKIFKEAYRRGCLDSELQCEAVDYIFNKLKSGKRFAQYDPQESRFTTWFNTVLINLFNDFFRKQEAQSIENEEISLDSPVSNDENSLSLHTKVADPRSVEDVNKDQRNMVLFQKMNIYLREEDVASSALFKLKYIHYYSFTDFTSSELEYICSLKKLGFHEIESQIILLKDKSYDKLDTGGNSDDKANYNFHRIKKLEKQLAKIDEKARNAGVDRLQKILDAKMKTEKALTHRKELSLKLNTTLNSRSGLVSLSSDDLVQFTGLTAKKIEMKISDILMKLREKGKDFFAKEVDHE